MRNIVLTGVAAAAALTLVSGGPASAAPTDTTTTTTTHSVTAASVAAVNPDLNPFAGGLGETNTYAGSIAPAGAITFPYVVSDGDWQDTDVDPYDNSYVDNLFSLPAAPTNCTRTVSSFSYSYDLRAVNSWAYDGVATYSALFSGADADAAPLSDASASTDGIGWLEFPEDYPGLVFHGLTSPYPEVMPLVGSITMEYPAPVAAETARGYVAFGYPAVSAWTLTDASFVVNDTCTSAVDVPPVADPPAVNEPVVPAAPGAARRRSWQRPVQKPESSVALPRSCSASVPPACCWPVVG